MAKKPSASNESSVYRSTEVIGTSPESWEVAARNAVEAASKTPGISFWQWVIPKTARWSRTAPACSCRSSTKAEPAGESARVSVT